MRIRPKRIAIYVMVVVLLLWILIPLYWLVSMSFMTRLELLSIPTHLYPHEFTLSNYTRMFGQSATLPDGTFLRPIGQGPTVRAGLLNSLMVSVPVAALTLLVALPTAYALGRLRFKQRTGILLAVMMSRSYPALAAAIPFMILFGALRLRGTQLGLIIMYLTFTIPFIVWMMANFFASLPRDLEGAARIDGCTRFGAFSRVVLPAAMPGVSACAVMAFLVSWSEFPMALFLTTGSLAQTLPPALAQFFFMTSLANEMATAAVLGFIPPAILAYIFQARIRRIAISSVY